MRVEPHWSQLREWRPGLLSAQKGELLAEALAAQGKMDKARAAYQAVGVRVAWGRKDAEVKRLACLEGANSLLRRGEMDDAGRILQLTADGWKGA